MRPTRHVLIVLPEHVHLMDVAGPAQVLVTAADMGAGYTVGYVSEHPITGSYQGVALAAAVHWPDLEPDDLVLVPGWKSPASSPGLSRALLKRIRGHWDDGGRIASVCAGALALAEAG